MELFCNAQQYNQTGVSWSTGSRLKLYNWLRLRLIDQLQEILLGHAIFASSEYGYHVYRRIARSIRGHSKNMSHLVGEGVRWGVTKCDRGGGSVALRDVTPVEFF